MEMNLYQVIRPDIKPGDVFAFGGGGFISGAIKLFTRSAVSHVATVYRKEDDDHVILIESTTLSGVKGVQKNLASSRIAEYDGSVWWLPLSRLVQGRLNWRGFVEFLEGCEAQKIPYDYLQVIRMMWAPLTHVPGVGFLKNHESFKRFFCSELIAAAFKASGVLPGDFNSSDTAPQDLCELALYRDCVQIKGKPQGIRKFNTRQIQWIAGATA